MPVQNVRNLPVDLTEEEKKQRAERLAEAIQKREKIKADRQNAVAFAYRETKELDAEIKTLSEVVSTGREVREVEVREVKDLGRRILTTVRIDTGETIDSRQLSIEELQDDLPFARQEGEHSVTYETREEQEEAGDPEPRKRKRSPKNQEGRA